MKLLVLSLLLTSSAIHASCGDLNIKIMNNSTHNCTFKNKVIYYGTLPSENIAMTIPAGQSSSIIRASQNNIGIGVLLTYMCDNEIVKFYSWQDYCGFPAAGDLGGQPQDSTTLNLDYSTQAGSYLSGLPGTITWRIS
ncbi:MAG: hypothetical protein P4L79_16560 [Legionella sp.]|uniref:hypothetical protein n=1 Tax=Legionella sp. TaxID=459 RepID=UPI00283AC2F6|nr:hypothetical protein [Legionella sp.]